MSPFGVKRSHDQIEGLHGCLLGRDEGDQIGPDEGLGLGEIQREPQVARLDCTINGERTIRNTIA
jgi:hypothetical protein